jgi:hypothetical protein
MHVDVLGGKPYESPSGKYLPLYLHCSISSVLGNYKFLRFKLKYLD